MIIGFSEETGIQNYYLQIQLRISTIEGFSTLFGAQLL